MAKTASSMLPLGTHAPAFSLLDVVSGNKVELRSAEDIKATVIMFICNHCPYVKHVNKELSQLAQDYISKGVNFIAINSNDIDNYPDDSPDNMRIIAQQESYPFPYLFDETQEVAKAYQAACTPDFYVFNSQLALAYRGQLDDSRPGNKAPVTGNAVRLALDCLLNNQAITIEQKPSLGCNIKWKN
ncbi:thiol-disulfide oxidoreductase [Legionella massiliensis]|uniref:Thiol-disulfide oxidoreductase n=1 Tax=Legionella massiliensis TaxID=1034943 RepID=A0A078L2K7_9GAMM|nr:thioredoxin family protein [Legionella massiliensis]CDZ78248.1 thiol-disulfide oxidoreductase [Legionella massiliensis]CEE13986.1 Thiol-disulfide oxidoreductase ResA [Legionella massiliensis]